MLYVVATPLGNLADFSARAIECLKDVEAVYAEDTRRSRILLEHFGIRKPLKSLHAHNEKERLNEILLSLEKGQSVALVTDAGTPAVSDPGALLVEQVWQHGFRVVPIPGASALTTALSACGFSLAGRAVTFFGFLPTQNKERQQMFKDLTSLAGVAVLFESPQRLQKTLQDLAALMPDRLACVCRELTKVHEEIKRATLQELATWADKQILGEITLVLGPFEKTISIEDQIIRTALQKCLDAGMTARDATLGVSLTLEVSKKHVYALCQALSEKS
jgi:16S rRNA (cytidine1402-2'-O)-methyltransferase